MSSALLSSAIYTTSSRLAHLKLNTIIEESPVSELGEERGRTRTPSGRKSTVSSPALSVSTISSYYQRSRGSREFDELYDVTDSESDQDSIEISRQHSRKKSNESSQSKRKNRYPSLLIPSPTHWPTIEKYRKDAGLALATPASIPLAPEVLAKLNMQARASSNPPSLDGSLASDQVANISTPSTPKEFCQLDNVKNWQQALTLSMYSTEDIQLDGEPEVHTSQHSSMLLSPEAFDVLQRISLGQETQDEEPKQEEMQEVIFRLDPAITIEVEPMSAVSEYSISAISVPSPGGLFGPNSDAASWFAIAPVVRETVSPTFSSIEDFYNSSCSQGIEISNTTSPRLHQFDSGFVQTSEDLSIQDTVELLDILDQESMFKNTDPKDRTSDWLAAQTSWLMSLREDIPPSKTQAPTTPITQTAPALPDTPESTKRAVRFLDSEIAKEAERLATAETEEKGDPLFYHAFQRMSMGASPTDSFVHRHSRFDAIQAQRTSLQLNYVKSLLGDYRSATVYRPAPQRPISMFPGKQVETENNLDDEEKLYFAALERERDATEQLAPAMWVVEALRYLSGGSLFNSPVAAHLSSAPDLESTSLPEHVRVLDLGGAPQCDWAWHCARDYPNVKTYTVILQSQSHNPSLHGPSNHRLVTVDHFYTLPFPTNHFDAISARSLAMYLKTTKPLSAGGEHDEYDLCLQECLRVLKPGGYLEFFLLDADLISSSSDPASTSNDLCPSGLSTSSTNPAAITRAAAPLASKLSVEFSLSLQQLGYDATPTKSFLARLRRNGYSSIKRGWMFLPLSATTEVLSSMPETPPPSGASLYDEDIFAGRTEAVHGPIGCTQDVAAVSGLVGGWMWESWVVKLAKECGKSGFAGLVGDVGGVIEEGRREGGGWRVLRGWARKPT